MGLSKTEELQALMREAHLKPKKLLGQNFLVDETALDAILAGAELKPSDVILEIGPGLGILTEALLTKNCEVVAVEKDRELSDFLARRFQGQKNLRLVNQDILKFDLRTLPENYKVVANIPYYLTSHLIQNFLEFELRPQFMILMVQKEVGDRITAGPGELSILGLSVQLYAKPEILATVPKDSFWPQPKVDSVIIKITPVARNEKIPDYKLFFRIIKIAFAGKRKQLANTLTTGLHFPKDNVIKLLEQAQISPQMRPQDLSLEQWAELYRILSLNGVK